MHNQSIKNLFIAGITLLSFGFLSAQFVIPSGINNAYQLIQRVWITTSGTTTGKTIVDLNTGSSKIYINPAFLSTTTSYNWQYLLTLDGSGYVSFASWSVGGWMSGAYISGWNLYLAFNNGSTTNLWWVSWATGQNGIWITNIVDNNNWTFTVNLSNGSGYTINIPGWWAQYWTQNGSNLYPTTLTNNVWIGLTNPTTTLGVSWTALMQNGNRWWEFVNDAFVPGIDRIGGSFSSGSEYVHQSIVDVFNGVPISNMWWFDTNTNQESNFTAFRQSATMHYNSNRLSINSGLWNGIDITPNNIEIEYDKNNASGDYAQINLGPLGISFDIGIWVATHMFADNGFVGINNINPSHTLTVSGTFIANDGNQGFESHPNLLWIGIPGAMSSISSGNTLWFLMAWIPWSNPIFNAWIWAYLGYVDMNTPNDERTILTIRSGSITMDITQQSNDMVEIDITPAVYSIASNNWSTNNLFIDFWNNRMGVNKANPEKALDVNGAIVSRIMTVTGSSAISGDGTYFFFVLDVQDVNTVIMQPEAWQVFSILGFINGSPGQEIRILSNSVSYSYNNPAADRLVSIVPHYLYNVWDLVTTFWAPVSTNQIFMHRYDMFGNDTSQENDGGTYIAWCTNQTTTNNTSCFIWAEFIFDGGLWYPVARF